MRWKDRRRSENVEDQRRFPTGGVVAGGGLGMLILVIIGMLFGADPAALLRQAQQNNPRAGAPGPGAGQGQGQGEGQPPVDPAQEELADFVKVVLADTEDVWEEQFRAMGKEYEKPTLVLFSGQVRSACGMASAAMGPFYCPLDKKVYIDLGFYEEMKEKFQAPGDFAQAYVIAHEIGHHVQNLLGISDKVQAMRARVGEAEGNDLSVRLELQADFLAGLWAHHAQKAKQILEKGDIEEALNAATAIGDDRLQKQSRGYVVPDSFTHGSSAQRVRWFRRGLQSGDINGGDTFGADQL